MEYDCPENGLPSFGMCKQQKRSSDALPCMPFNKASSNYTRNFKPPDLFLQLCRPICVQPCTKQRRGLSHEEAAEIALHYKKTFVKITSSS